MSLINKALFFWRRSLLWKLMLVNGLVIGVVIWFTGVSVKDFACFLVNQYTEVSEDGSQFFNTTMHYYLLRASLAAIIIATLVHYFFIRNILSPLKQLAVSSKQMTKGIYPNPIKVSDDEVGQLSEDFNHMVETLKEAEESRKHMISDISHELRTPLSNLNGYLEALSTGVIDGDLELYRSLHEEAKHLSGLVEQLHQLTVWESKRVVRPAFDVVSMDRMIQSSIQSFDLELSHRNIQLSCTLDSGAVRGDEGGLKQVMLNLLKNAIQYDRGGWIKVEGLMSNAQYQVKVTNEGEIIPADKSKHIFERFYRMDPARQRATGGSGLGLAIVKEIITQHDGHVGLESKGNEHTFWFSLPLIR